MDRIPSWLYRVLVVSVVGTLLFKNVFVLVTLFGGMTLICIATMVTYPLRNVHRDPYDLTLLKEIHEREELEAAAEAHRLDEGDVVCSRCGHVYGSKFKVCPNCMQSP